MDSSTASYESSRRGFLRALAAVGVASPLLLKAESIHAAVTSAAAEVSRGGAGHRAAQALASRYLLRDDIVYLNHASIGTVPRAVHEAHVGYLELCESHPSLYVWGRVWRDVLEDTRATAAELLGSRPDDLAVTHNTTEGFNILAQGLPLGPGDEVLFSSLNHPGASVAWRGQAPRRGFTVRDFDVPLDRVPDLTVDDVVGLHAEAIRPETRALVLPHVDNVVGMVHPLQEIARAARSRGVDFVLVDGAQSVGMIPVDLDTAGVDAYAASPHKWLQAPKGLGLFWVSQALQAALPRMWYRTPGRRIESSARQYEDYSTRSWPAVVALGDALAFQAALGEAEKQQRYKAIRRGLLESVDAESGLLWRSPRSAELGSVIMAVEVAGRDASALGSMLLEDHGVVVRAFGAPTNTLRVSPNVATTDAQLGIFLDAVRT